MTGSYVPYERPPQPFTLWSAIPRGLQSFLVPTAALDAKAFNDIAILNLTATLPPNFAYVMADIMVALTQDRVADWDNLITLNLQNFYRTAADSVGLSATYLSALTLGPSRGDGLFLTRTENSSEFPSFPIIGSPGTSGVLVVINANNPTDTAAAIGTINAYISFWQFDLEQIRKYPINSPQPVHAR